MLKHPERELGGHGSPRAEEPPDSNPARVSWYVVASVVAAVLALRLPWLLSPGFILDGDESILGLMARHIAQGRELPVFFWGQAASGFSLLETLPAALAFRMFGAQPLVLSLTMLCLFAAALLLYGLAFRSMTRSSAWALLLASALALQPVWITWSMKARGGYLSAFLGLAVILVLVTRDRFSRGSALAAGVAAGVVAVAQPLWLACALPLCAFRGEPATRRDTGLQGAATRADASPRARATSLVYSIAALIVTACVARLFAPGHPYWSPPLVDGFDVGRLLEVPVQLQRMFTGFFYLGAVFPAPPVISIVATTATVAAFAAPVAMGLCALRRRDLNALVLCVALLGPLTSAVVLTGLAPRYLLSASVMPVIAGAWLVGAYRVRFTGVVRLGAIGALVALAVASTGVRHFRFHAPDSVGDNEAQLGELIARLRSEEVRGIFSMSGLLQWQIMFYSREQLIARCTSPVDRYPPFVEQVNAMRRAGARTALVGIVTAGGGPIASPFGETVTRVGDVYFYVLDPTPQLLQAVRFRDVE